MLKTIIVYATRSGKEPFTTWLNKLSNARHRRHILTRLRRLEQGNFGDCKYLRNGVYELRFFISPGYRIYFGLDDDKLIILLNGGDKHSQKRDISLAIQYWEEYQDNA